MNLLKALFIFKPFFSL